jgi:beta-mannosidase
MIAQAEGLKFGIEHYRRRKPHCSGALVWQLNDCWPVLSWSVMDYYGNGKAGYFYLKRVFSPVLASFKEVEGGVELWMTNETLSPISETITIRQGTFDGALDWSESVKIAVPANSSQCVWQRAGNGGADRYLAVSSPAQTFPGNRHFFAPIKDLVRTVKPVAHSISAKSDGTLEVAITAPADAYAYFVHINATPERTRFTDNYFDLEPGEQRTITVSNASHPLTPADLTIKSR